MPVSGIYSTKLRIYHARRDRHAAPRAHRQRPVALRGGGENGEVKQAVSGGAEPVAEPVRSLLVTFNVECDSTTPQDTIGVVGSCPELGEWKQVTLMSAKDWPKWTMTTPMCELYENVQYKYVRVDANGATARALV